MTELAWLVGHDDIGYLVIKATTRGRARWRGGQAMGAADAEEIMYLRALRRPDYDHLPEEEAHEQYFKNWETKDNEQND